MAAALGYAGAVRGDTAKPAPWRADVLQAVLDWSASLGAGLVVLTVGLAAWRSAAALSDPSFWLMYLPYFGVVALRFSRTLAFRTRVLAFEVLLVALGGLATYATGMAPAPLMVLALSVVSSGLFIGRRGLWVALAATTATLAVVGVLFDTAELRAFELLARPSLGRWLAACGGYALSTGIVAVLVHHVVERIEAAHAAAADALRQRDREARGRGEAQAALGESQAALVRSQKLEAVGKLAAGVGHDFNNALQVVLAWTEMLHGERDPATLEEGLQAIEQSARRSSHLTQRLLAFGRRDVRAPAPLRPQDAMEELARSLRRLLPEDIRIDTHFAEVPDVFADAGQLDQVLLNLGINARDAMPEGGVLVLGAETAPTAELPPAPPGHEVEREGVAAWAHLWVRDDGVGMAGETCDRIFDPFFSTKGERGTGLGLATAHAIVRAHGGAITVQSELGQGTCFHVYLPAHVQPNEPLQPVSPRVHHPAETGRGRACVMLAEDDDAVRGGLEHALRRAGHRVVSAADAQAAMGVLDSHAGEIDVLCTDAIMPGGGTHHLIDRYRALHPAGHVIVCSGYVEEELLRRQIDAGALAYLPKPFAPATLVARIAAMTHDGGDASPAPAPTSAAP